MTLTGAGLHRGNERPLRDHGRGHDGQLRYPDHRHQPGWYRGSVDVTVTAPAGTSAISRPADQFTYLKKAIIVKEIGKEAGTKETFALEKVTELARATPAVAAEEMTGGTAEAFIEPSERPDVGAQLRDDDATAPEQ